MRINLISKINRVKQSPTIVFPRRVPLHQTMQSVPSLSSHRTLTTSPPSDSPPSDWSTYLSKASLSPFVPTPEPLAHNILTSVSLGGNDTHIDLGCGWGSLNGAALVTCMRTVGVDVDKDVIAKGRERYGDDVEWRVEDLRDVKDVREMLTGGEWGGRDLVITCYMVTEGLEVLEPMLVRAMREVENCRVVTVDYRLPGGGGGEGGEGKGGEGWGLEWWIYERREEGET